MRIGDHILKIKKQLSFTRSHLLKTLHPAYTGQCLQNMNPLRTDHIQAIHRLIIFK